MTTVRFATSPPRKRRELTAPPAPAARSARPGWGSPVALTAASVIAIAAALLIIPALTREIGTASTSNASLPLAGALTITVFLVALWGWVFSPLDDTLVAFLAAAALIVCGALPAEQFFGSLGDPTIWLLICACILAAGVAASGLALRGAAQLVSHARSPRALCHLVTIALVLTAFAIPATSGRAALALPVYTALVSALPTRPQLHRALGLLFPTVILLSAMGSLLGAGAHLITSQLLAEATGTGFTFVGWLVLGLPLAAVSSHLACEVILFRFTSRQERSTPLRVSPRAFADSSTPVTGPLTRTEYRALVILLCVIVLWCTEPIHGLPPEVVALLGALLAALPRVGVTTLKDAVKQVPWNLLLFLAATLALGSALTETGAAAWLGGVALAPVSSMGTAAGPTFLLLVIAVSLSAHLIIQSRSARSAALIPVVIALAPSLGVDPASAALASTAAAGFCQTLPSSAKPVALFASEGRADFDPRDLRLLAAWLAPLLFVLITSCVFWVWPVLGLPAFL